MRESDADRLAHDEAMELTAAEASLAARLGVRLREGTKAAADFDSRVMHRVRSESASHPAPGPGAQADSSWWTRRRTITFSPLAGLATAAGLVAVVSLGAQLANRTLVPADESAQAVAVPVDTLHLVRFLIQQPKATRVTLVGDFNGWSREATPLEVSEDGSTWTTTVSLEPGRYDYAFVIDDQRWTPDPLAMTRRDEFSTETSILRLAGSRNHAM